MQPKFLIVDDQEDALNVLEGMLTGLQCQVVRARSGEEVLQIVHQEQRAAEFDAIFVDILMPQMSGLALIRALRAEKSTAQTPLIAVTGVDRREEIIEAYGCGASYYITKPYTKEQLTHGLDLLFGDDGQESQVKVHYTKYE
jgi:CheY-like chemotaxis protein